MIVKMQFPGILCLLAVALLGCATTPKEKESLIIWPQPPEEPRVAYLRSHYGERDFVKSSIFDALFGKPPMSVLPKPYGVFAAGNKIYVTLSAAGRVAVIDTKERKVIYIGDAGAGRLSMPIGIAGTSDGTLYVSDVKLNRIFVYDTEGQLKFAIGRKDELKNPSGIAVNEELKRLYVADAQSHTIHVYSLEGVKLFQFGRAGGGDGELYFPSNIAIQKRTGNVYVVDTQNFRVQVFDKEGKFLKKFGSLGDRIGNFSRPKGIGIDSEGHVYVADAAFDNFQIFDENGQLLLYVGSAGTSPGFFQLPAGIYVDERNRIYVVDQLNGRVQVFQYLSDDWKKANPEELKKYLPSMGL